MHDPRSGSSAPGDARQPTAADVLDTINASNANTANAIQTLTITMTNFLAALQPFIAFSVVASSPPTSSPTSAPAQSPLPPGIKPPTPKQYSGNMKDALTWTTATAATLAFANWDMHAPQVVQYAASFLTGRALRWWHGCCNTALASSSPLAASGGFANWSEFATALTTALGESHPRDRARDRLFNLRQTSSVNKYNEQFSDLAQRLPNTHWEDLSYLYRMGLQPAIRELMLGRYSDTDTWSQLAKLAATCDTTPSTLPSVTFPAPLPPTLPPPLPPLTTPTTLTTCPRPLTPPPWTSAISTPPPLATSPLTPAPPPAADPLP